MVERVRVAALGNEQKTQLSQKLGVRLASWDFRQQGIQARVLCTAGGGMSGIGHGPDPGLSMQRQRGSGGLRSNPPRHLRRPVAASSIRQAMRGVAAANARSGR
jgi:hypothetical protein